MTPLSPVSSKTVIADDLRLLHGVCLYLSGPASQWSMVSSPCLPPCAFGQLKLPAGQWPSDESLVTCFMNSALRLPPPTVGVAAMRLSMQSLSGSSQSHITPAPFMMSAACSAVGLPSSLLIC